MSLLRHSLLNFGGTTVPIVVALATIPAYLRYAGAETFGVLALVWTSLAYLSILDFGFGRAMAQKMSTVAEADVALRSRLLWTALLATTAIGTVVASAVWIALDQLLELALIASKGTADSIREIAGWLLVAIPCVVPLNVLQGALQARLRFAELAVVQVLSSLCTQLFPLAFAIAGMLDLGYLIPAALVGRLVSFSLLIYLCRRHVPIGGPPVFDVAILKGLAAYGGWMTVISVVSPLFVTVDRFIIAAIGGASAVALYTVPYEIGSRVMTIPGSVYGAL
ncbi:MAG: oligosaccharide flippase family protein, partial [Phycisphaeraceae bacterium]|nr:oligosaccharide flippase family protein [Phycisphaeraceae bacterium]MBX3672884.1 oligosaccharide flippase family protein [Burkholderiales bacterium]